MGLILIGVLSGIVTGLGMGGGSILILILTTFMSVGQHTAQAANLIFFIPTAITAIIVHFRNGNVEKKVGKKLLYTIIVGAAVGAHLTSLLSSESLKKYFGIFLLIIAITDIISTLRKNKNKRLKEERNE